MRRNVEIKARIHDPGAVRKHLQGMGCIKNQELRQEDIFFPTHCGRLKLRIFSAQRSELIYYERSDCFGPTESRYLLAPCSDPETLRAVLSAALGIRGVVRKRREVYLMGQTRIHLDEVERLGSFIEFEVVLTPDQTVEEGEYVARSFLSKLNIEERSLIACAYIDLLEEQNKSDRTEGKGDDLRVTHVPNIDLITDPDETT